MVKRAACEPSALRFTTNRPTLSPLSNAVSVARVMLVLMLIGILADGLSGVVGGVTGDTGSSLPPQDIQQSTAMQTDAIKDAFFTTCFIIINFRFYITLLTLLQNYKKVKHKTSP